MNNFSGTYKAKQELPNIALIKTYIIDKQILIFKHLLQSFLTNQALSDFFSHYKG